MMKNRTALHIILCAACFIAGFSSEAFAAREMTEYPRVKLQSLDKITARTETFEAKVGSTLKFGPLFMRVQTCQKASPIDEPESAAFLQIWENNVDGESEWVFSGWMFASSPGLSAMDHAIYDVWVIDCLDYEEGVELEGVQGDDQQDGESQDSDIEQGDMLQE